MLRIRYIAAALVAAALFLAAPAQARKQPQPQNVPAAAATPGPDDPIWPVQKTRRLTVYDGQPDCTEAELLHFIKDLPDFRAWIRSRGEQARPFFANGRADFRYSRDAADWVTARGWDPRRFFCLMGRTAAAFTVVTEGPETAAKYRDMPRVSEAECSLIRAHLAELLKAGSDAAPPPQR